VSYQNILVEKDEADKIAVVTINRPDKLNALNSATIHELINAFTELETDSSVRVVIMTGAGEKAFVAGADISELNKLPSAVAGATHARLGQSLTFKVEKLGKPVIMAINGYALGGGLELAMAGDIRIASETAQVGQPEIDLGIIPGFGGTQRLSRLVGRGMAKLMVMGGQRIPASEAYRLGLVEKVVPAASLMEEAKKIAALLVAKSPIALKLAKDAINEGMETDLEAGCLIEADKFGLACGTADKAEGTAAFLEKRKPNFSGQ
jgi:enoyl-CoA hydratase